MHIDEDGSHALEPATIRQAAEAGLVRLTTGLESGSQRVLDLMKKGTQLAETSHVLRGAAAAGVSVRATVMVGYPGETARDVAATARFLDDHREAIERVPIAARPPRVRHAVSECVELDGVRRRPDFAAPEQDLQRLASRHAGAELAREAG